MNCSDDLYPKWLNELKRYLPIVNQYYLYGNIHDTFPYPEVNPDSHDVHFKNLYLRDYLYRFFHDIRYEIIGFYDIIDGFMFYTNNEKSRFKKLTSKGKVSSKKETQSDGKEEKIKKRPRHALDLIRTALANTETATVFVLDYSSLLASSPERLDQSERELFLKITKVGNETATVKIDGRRLYNCLILVIEKPNDLPSWLYVNNPHCKLIEIARPTEEERQRYFKQSFHLLYGAEDIADKNKDDFIDSFTDLTHGMMNRELVSIIELSKNEEIPVMRPKDIIEMYKFGVKESPWEALRDPKKKRVRLENAVSTLSKKVKGQSEAIRATVDIIKRASEGLSGIQHSSKGHKPKGVLFFAGPTGVGKTLLAKSLAELLFGDESACIRFDMSEYGQPHSDQKFFGAPPGYVGYEAGGQLINKVRANPFSVLLFDEIEKAHPHILDKFLQILEDGRLTSGQGETVYFSECIIIFTSNKGISKEVIVPTSKQKVHVPIIRPKSWECKKCHRYYFTESAPKECLECGISGSFSSVVTPYRELRRSVLSALEDYFKSELGRPEIYNRFGNNFVVFDYIRPPIMLEIIEGMLGTIKEELKEKRNITITFSGEIKDRLLRKTEGDLEHGGRGVGNTIETMLVNPMARKLFDENVSRGSRLNIMKINEVEEDASTNYTLEWSRTDS